MAKNKQQQKSSRRRDGVRIRETGRREFEADFTVSLGDGQRLRFRRRSPSNTIEGTRAWAERERDAIIKRGGKAKPQAPQADPTRPRSFGYWGKRYLEECRREGINRVATLKNKETALRLYLLPRFASRAVASFEPEDIRDYILDRRGQDSAHETVRKEVTYLRAILKHAKRYGSPVERALTVPFYRQRQPAEVRKRLPISLSEEEARRLLAAAENELDLALLTCLFRQGMRVGEVLGLRWGTDVDLSQRRIIIQRAWSKMDRGWAPTKSGKPRTIAMDPETAAALEGLGEGGPGALLFPSAVETRALEGKPISYSAIMVRLRRTAERAGLDTSELSTKTGRHSLGRHWAERGWPMRGLQEFLGHHDVSVTQVYAHWSVGATADLLASRLGESSRDEREELAAIRASLDSHGIDSSAGLAVAISSLLSELTKLRPKLEE